ncbi:MAG TPA: hypothetical protein VIJ66_01150 [Solirubrobacteraceae bacterium]
MGAATHRQRGQGGEDRLVAAIAYIWDLSASGYANSFYAAAGRKVVIPLPPRWMRT